MTRKAGRSLAEKKQNQDDATVKAARAISEGVLGHKLEEREKRAAGAAVHYAFGTVTGGFYGAVAEFAEGHSRSRATFRRGLLARRG